MTNSLTVPTVFRNRPLFVYLLAAGLATAIFLPLFLRFSRATDGDFFPHLLFARRFALSGLPASERFGFEILTLLVAGFSSNLADLARAGAVVATASMVAKLLVSVRWLADEMRLFQAAVLGFVLVFLAPVTLVWQHALRPDVSPVHLGQISGLIFHNPTTVLVFPLALLLFRASWRERWLATAVLAAVQCLVKPSFVLAWAPVWIGWITIRHRHARRHLALAALTLAPVVAVLTWQFLSTNQLGGGMSIQPLRVWRSMSNNIPLSIARSIAFPALFTILHWRQLRGRHDHAFAWAILAVATAQFALLRIEGRAYAGNWSWGRYLAIYPVFLLTLARFGDLARRRASWTSPLPAIANSLLAGVLLLHLYAGVRYYWEGVQWARW